MKESAHAAGKSVAQLPKEWHTQLTQTANAGAEAVMTGLNEIQAIVQDDNFLKVLGLGIALGVVGCYFSNKYGEQALSLASRAIGSKNVLYLVFTKH